MVSVGTLVTVGQMDKDYEFKKNEQMVNFRGRVTKVKEVRKDISTGKKEYRLAIDKGKNRWSEDMLKLNEG